MVDSARSRDVNHPREERGRLVSFRDARPDGELVRATLKDDRRAKSELFRRHLDRVAGIVYRLIGNDVDLEDLVQDTFEEAFRKLHKLQRPESFRGWLRCIAVGRAISHLRRRQLRRRLGLLRREPIAFDELISTGAPPDVALELRAVYRILNRLPVAERVVLVLRRVEECSVREIAETTGWSAATVKRKVARAAATLARELEEDRR